jgi:hypothetical protein
MDLFWFLHIFFLAQPLLGGILYDNKIWLLINRVWIVCNKILNAEFKGDKYFVDEVET